jgi:predicted nucleic acid-binding Zn ribbon protein
MALNPSDLARQLAACRKPRLFICPVCGKRAVGIGRRTYCRERCAKHAWWQRQRSKTARLAAATAAPQAWADDGGGPGSREALIGAVPRAACQSAALGFARRSFWRLHRG